MLLPQPAAVLRTRQQQLIRHGVPHIHSQATTATITMPAAAFAALSPITAPVALLCLVAATAIAALWTHSNRRQWNKELVELKSVASQALSKDSKLLDVDRLLATNPAYKRDHVFHDTLNHYQGVQCPYVTYDRDSNSLKAVVRFGEQTRGHPNLVHGGITSLTFDNLLGWLQFLEGRMAVLTAYLHVDFKAPLPTTTQTMVEVKMDRQEGRKLFMVGAIMSLDGNITYATCTSLFVIPKDARLPGAMAAAP
ncbi:HotDog domain-containing protein [Tribonema minus]|uniref:HotDog domain-containing protein n=1 Tax=Tribonema minus TaxID=303371 RepID=A0A835YMX9_9STRA|nr:HotDog domain-containing protein [Tribonema minus]